MSYFNELIYFSFNQKSSILLIFFFNAILFSVLLLKKGFSENRQDNKWLSLFIFLGGLYISPFMLGYAGWYSIKSYREVLFFIPLQQVFLFGPIIYFYTQSLLNNKFQFLQRDLLHFIPAAVYFIYSLLVFFTDKIILDDYFFYADGRDKDFSFWYQLSGVISLLFYLLLSIRYYRNYKLYVVQVVSYADEILFKWLSHFMTALSLLLVLRILFFIINPEWGQFGNKYWYYLCFSILFLYIAISGYSNAIRKMISFEIISNNFLPAEITLSLPATEDPNYVIDNIEDWKRKIVDLIETKQLYKNANLTLSDVAASLNTNRNLISSVINQGFKMNFNDFINVKRVEAVIEKINGGEHLTTTFIGLAFDNGFNSKSTFNRAFKKHTSFTPRQYIIRNKL